MSTPAISNRSALNECLARQEGLEMDSNQGKIEWAT